MIYFPIYRLNSAITETLKKITSLDIAEGIREGLDPMIHFVDEQGGPLSTVAKITERAVNVDRVEDLILVFGSFDENIKRIED